MFKRYETLGEAIKRQKKCYHTWDYAPDDKTYRAHGEDTSTDKVMRFISVKVTCTKCGKEGREFFNFSHRTVK